MPFEDGAAKQAKLSGVTIVEIFVRTTPRTADLVILLGEEKVAVIFHVHLDRDSRARE